MIVYIAGPYTKGNVESNVRDAIIAAEKVSNLGHTPYIPHLTYFWHLTFPHSIDFWYKYDMQFLILCSCILRLSGDSIGADNEVIFAKGINMPVYYSIESLPKGD